ncbi:MAG: hypothetical protein AB7G93_21885 [Bdellovibrionales bacterium]
MRYRLFGLTLESEIALGISPRPAAQGVPRIRIERGRVLPTARELPRTLEIHPQSYGACLSLPGFGFARFVERTRCLKIDTPAQMNSEDRQSVILSQAVPFALSYLGEILLHASAITDGHRAVIFLGPKGQGKSTLAARAVSDRFQLLSDDTVRVDVRSRQVRVHPAFPEIRMFARDVRARWTNVRTRGAFSKVRVDLSSRFCEHAVPLRAAYLVRGGRRRAGIGGVLSGAAAFAAWASNTLVCVSPSRSRETSRFRRLSRLADLCAVRPLDVVHKRDAALNWSELFEV